MQVVSVNESSNTQIIPQMFFRFQGAFHSGRSAWAHPDMGLVVASELFLTTSTRSSALMNITLSAAGRTLEQQLDSSVGIVAVIGLSQKDTSTLAITYVGPGTLDIGAMWITVPDDS